ETLGRLVDELIGISKEVALVFAVHPRTRKRLTEFGLLDRLAASPQLHLTEPLPYIQFMALVTRSQLVITDSGGVQEESTYLSIPCLTLRENTERPITVTQGTNRLVTLATLRSKVDEALAGRWHKGSAPEGWDGKASQRCVEALRRRTG